MSSLKFKMPKNRSEKIHTKCPPIAFRTILKCRNNSLEPIPAVDQPENRSRSVSRISSSSRISRMNQPVGNQYIRKDKTNHSNIYDEESSKFNIKDMQAQMIATPRSTSTSRLKTSTYKLENNNQVQTQVTNLEELEKRIDKILKQKLQKYKQNKKGVGLKNWGYLCKQTIQLQFQEILKQIRANKPNEQSLAYLNARVDIIEKMIASETLQDQLIKQRYHGLTSQRSNLTSFHRTHTQVAKKINQKLQTNIHKGRKDKLQTVGNFVSTNRDAFSKPSKESYDNKRYKHAVYSPNRQVLPRSSYSTDFLKYGIMPTFDCKQLGMESLPSHSSLAVKTSSYKVQFKQRPNNCKPANYRDMDCYRDKFKNPNISFMNHCKRQMLDASNNLKKTTSRPNFNKLFSQTSFTDFYKTQQRRNYQGYTTNQTQESQWIRAVPKQGRLQQIKNSLKQSFLRV